MSINRLDVDFQMDFKYSDNWANIGYFEVKIIRGKKGTIYSNKSFGDLITNGMNQAFTSLKKGDLVIFENIKSEKFNYNPVTFTIQ